MSDVIKNLLFQLNVIQYAKYDIEGLFAKTRDELVAEIEEMSPQDKIELLESSGTKVDESFEDGGRWTNYITEVFSFWHNRESVYIQIHKEVPATEIQDCGDFMEPEIERVYPKKIETTIYTTTKEE